MSGCTQGGGGAPRRRGHRMGTWRSREAPLQCQHILMCSGQLHQWPQSRRKWLLNEEGVSGCSIRLFGQIGRSSKDQGQS